MHMPAKCIKTGWSGASLVAQWLRICLPKQETRVQSLVRDDSICCGATKPVYHEHWICALEARNCNLLKPMCPRACTLQQEKPPQWEAPALQLESSPCSSQQEKTPSSSEDPAQPKINKIILFLKLADFASKFILSGASQGCSHGHEHSTGFVGSPVAWRKRWLWKMRPPCHTRG